MAENAKWYVVHTYSGYENTVAASIEKAVENRGLRDKEFRYLRTVIVTAAVYRGLASGLRRYG